MVTSLYRVMQVEGKAKQKEKRGYQGNRISQWEEE